MLVLHFSLKHTPGLISCTPFLAVLTVEMSGPSFHNAALNRMLPAFIRAIRELEFTERLMGQIGLVRSMLSQDPSILDSKDEVRSVYYR